MKRLILVRHAKSSWDHPGLRDIERPLNKRGKRDAPRMGERLRERGVLVQALFASPARRARKTAELIAASLGYPKKAIKLDLALYEANVWDLLRLLRKTSERVGSLLIVGHNPACTNFVNYLTGAGIDNLPTCAVVCVDFPVDSWSRITRHSGSCIFIDQPGKK